MLHRVINSSKLVPQYVNKCYYLTALSMSSLSKQYSDSGAVKCSIFDGTDIGMAKSILRNDFTANKEPLCYHLSSRNFDFMLGPYLKKAIDDKLSLIITVNDIFAGIAVNNDFTVKEDEEFMEALKKRDYYGFDLVFQLERDLNHDFRHEMHDKGLFEKGTILRMLLFGIDPHYGHRGLGSILTEETVERAKEMGYKYVTAAATNYHMKHGAEKSGFICLNTIKYSEWEYPKGSGVYPKKGMQEITGFDEMSFMVKKL